MDWIDALNIHSIEFIEMLQTRLSSWEWWIVRVSVVGDNREAFLFFFPLLAGLSIACGAKLLWAAILVEWSNLIMKWLISGDRPYWYVHETPHYTNSSRPVLLQFPNTCESGPGTPSGHIMMNVAIFYIFIRSICSLYIFDNLLLSKGHQKAMAAALWVSYAVWVSLVFLSRLYILAHFIHQCVLGVLVGLLIGYCCWHCDPFLRLGLVYSVFVSLFFLFSAGSVYTALLRLGYDPLWSVSKALKYCSDPVNVKVETQPYYIMARFTGSALGLGLGMSSVLSTLESEGRLLRALLGCKGGIILGRIATIILGGMSRHDVARFMTLALGVHAALSYSVVTTLPYTLARLLPPPQTAAAPARKHKTY